jgi:hypothetical protein
MKPLVVVLSVVPGGRSELRLNQSQTWNSTASFTGNEEDLGSDFNLKVHNGAPEKFFDRFPPILGSGHRRCSVQTAIILVHQEGGANSRIPLLLPNRRPRKIKAPLMKLSSPRGAKKVF